MKKLLVIISIFLLAGCGGKSDAEYLKEYNAIEKDMVKASKVFMQNNPKLVPTGKNIYSIKLDNLYIGNYITNKFKDPKTDKECSKDNSYVHVKTADGKLTYTAYLECGDYKTK